MKRSNALQWACLLLLTVAVACGGGDEAGDALGEAAEGMQQAGEEAAGTVQDVVDDATSGAADAIQETADQIKTAIADKEAELQALKDRIANLSAADMGQASELKDQADTLMQELDELKAKLEQAMQN